MKNTIYAIFISVIFLGTVFSQTNSWGERTEFNLGQRNYKYENGDWFNYTSQKKGDRIYPQRLIIKKRSNSKVTYSDFHKLGIVGIKNISKKLYGNYYIINISKEHDPFLIAKELFDNGDYEYIEFDAMMKKHSIPNDNFWDNSECDINGQWNLKSSRLSMSKAWDITKGTNDVVLAIIDDGVEISHPDLQNNIWENTLEVQGQSGVDDDNNGYVDDLHGWHFTQLSGNNNIDGPHGTKVVGIAAARSNNSIGVAGIAGGWGSSQGIKFMVLRYDEDTNNYGNEEDPIFSSTVAQSIQYAAENGADVINMSFGSYFNYPFIEQQINYAVNSFNCICIASTGNYVYVGDSKDVHFPARYSKVISVGAVDPNDVWLHDTVNDYWGSCWDTDDLTEGKEIDVVAPQNVITTYPNDEYCRFEWTSASAQHVSGLVSLIRSINNGITYSQVRTILSQTSTNSPVWEAHYGYGRINAYKALKYTLENYGGTLKNDLVVHSGETWNFETGVTVTFENNKRLKVYGTLNVNGDLNDKVTFDFVNDNSSNGIKFYEGSGGIIENAIIKNATYGVYVYKSSPSIKNCVIHDCEYGIKSYYNSPTVETNEIYNTYYGMYFYKGNAIIRNNYVHNTTNYAILVNRVYNSTFIRENTIDYCSGGVYAYGNNSVKLRGGSGQNSYGKNIINNCGARYPVYITGGTPDLGEAHPSSHKGYNNIYRKNGSYVVKNTTGNEVMAEKNYWGSSSPSSSWFYGNVEWGDYLTSPYSGAGSSLDKITGSEPDKEMLYEANELVDSKSYNRGEEKYKQLIADYPESKYGGIAFVVNGNISISR